MIMLFEEYLTINNIYLWVTLGLIPFWLMLIFAPRSSFTQVFVNSVIFPGLISSAYIYIIYKAILSEENFLDVFQLYLSLENLYTIFANESFLLVFWLHFSSLNLFIGCWASRDAIKYGIPRSVVSFPLILIYLVGPIGLTIYWVIRIFYSRRLGFHD